MDQNIFHPKAKIIESLERLKQIRETAKRYKFCFVLTTGAFDLLHDGHVLYLMNARKQGFFLAVGVDSDSLVKNIKGPGRPVRNEIDRAIIIASLAFTDYVIIHDGSEELVRELKPDVFVVSETTKTVGKRNDLQWVGKNGGKIVSLPSMSDNHTSEMISTIKNYA